MMRTSETTDKLFKALVEAAPEITGIQKTKQANGNGRFGYKYATLDSLIDMLRQVLPKHGIWFMQMPTTCENALELKTRVFHQSGEWLEDSIICEKTEISNGNDTQKLGASITYFRRYALASIFGVANDEDTDGVPAKKSQPAMLPAQQRAVEQKRDPVPFLLAVTDKMLKDGETKESILRHFADILNTDNVREIGSMTDEERSCLARELFKRHQDIASIVFKGV